MWTARSGGGRRPGCSARGPFPRESGPGSREPVSRTDLGDLCFVISCRPVGFRKRRGTRSFPPRPPSLRPPPPPLTVFERERRCDGPVPPPRVSGAGLPSPPPWRVTAGPAPGPDPRPRAALCGSPAARAAHCGSPPPRDLAPAGGRAGGGRAASGRGSRRPRRAVHVDLAAVSYPRREGAVPGRYPGVPCLFPPLFGAPRVWLPAWEGECALSHGSRLGWEAHKDFLFPNEAVGFTFNIYLHMYLRKHMLSKLSFHFPDGDKYVTETLWSAIKNWTL